uniref:Uncharacterized protein n=1 Tax=Lymantria dispar multicapsid nuclear polyhedrosis virus TaxID=10449 RepID=A0A1B1MR20_NPVLD|nr:hypothetical protein [Lymantria dispar multiple nucleopolyhedrovirus]
MVYLVFQNLYTINKILIEPNRPPARRSSVAVVYPPSARPRTYVPECQDRC